MRGVKIGNFFGGMPIVQQKEQLKKEVPTIVVGTPGRIKQVCTPLLQQQQPLILLGMQEPNHFCMLLVAACQGGCPQAQHREALRLG
jgi:hypothetical protein